ncbi:vWA domain-containing protein [Neolewinella antarctica]|uniref:Metal-dependent peptidase n=1 Tax=Neolewinella antarctica TaxID=442734 RepID=A0ABX0XG62_9BACT|nr:VWA-like domain-containing protein [Neolewinella antarctica]NJC28300.1 putative metal-dependent peptidase [Neolewinella antarctica]
MSSVDHRTASDRIRFARAYAAQRLPWFGPALFRCRIIVTERTEVASIDLSYNVYWNPAAVAEIWASNPEEIDALKEIGFLWIHEISHRLRQHAERRESLLTKRPVDPRTWNIAADFEINDNPWPGLTMPAVYPGMLPGKFGFANGRLAEEYLTMVEGAEHDFALLPDEGSGVHGEAREWETGDVQDISDLDTELIRRKVADEMKKAGPSAIPASWRSWSESVLTSKTNWRRSLSHRMSVAIHQGIGSRIDYSFARPSRRQAVYHPILAPSLRGDRTARIAIVVDTSGSIGSASLKRSLAEVAGVVRTFRYPVTIIPCDNRTFEPVRVVAAEEAYRIQSLPGGGLTDMRAGIAEAQKLRPKPDVILVLTDGFTPYPKERLAVPVVFGILLEENSVVADVPRPPQPPFGPRSVLLIRPD